MSSQKLLDLYSSIDCFGITPSLNINSKAQFKSLFGATLTLLVAGFSIFIIYHSSADMIYKRNPQVNFSEKILDDPGTV